MIDVAAGILIDDKGRVLLAERPRGKPLAGWWEFPGGKFEAGEDAHAALCRELHEELGIRIETAEVLTVIDWAEPSFPMRLHALVVRAWRGTPTPREGQRLRWELPPAIDEAKLAPPDRPALAALRAHLEPAAGISA